MTLQSVSNYINDKRRFPNYDVNIRITRNDMNIPTVNDAIRFIPEDEINKIIEWGTRRGRDNRWLAKEAIKIIEHDRINNDERIGKMLIYDAVAILSGAIKARTVRLYVMTELFYPPEAWDEFSMLPHSHFVFAANRDNWREILTKSVQLMDDLGGRPPSVENLEALFCFPAPAIIDVTPITTPNPIDGIIDNLEIDTITPIVDEQDENQVLILKNIVELLKKLLDMWKGDKRKLKIALTNLLDLMN